MKKKISMIFVLTVIMTMMIGSISVFAANHPYAEDPNNSGHCKTCGKEAANAVHKAAVTTPADGGSSEWRVDTVLNKSAFKLKGWGGLAMIVLGVAMIIVGIFKIATALMSHGKKQVSWAINIALILVGALFCLGPAMFNMLTNDDDDFKFGDIMNTELEDLGK